MQTSALLRATIVVLAWSSPLIDRTTWAALLPGIERRMTERIASTIATTDATYLAVVDVAGSIVGVSVSRFRTGPTRIC